MIDTDIASYGGAPRILGADQHHQNLNPQGNVNNYDRQTKNQWTLGCNLPPCIRRWPFDSADPDETEQCGERNLWVPRTQASMADDGTDHMTMN